MGRSRFVSTCLALASLSGISLGAEIAHAWEPDTHRSGAGGDFYPWHDNDVTTFPLVGFANIGVTDVFYIDIYAPFTFSVNGDAIGGIGNPTALFRYAPHHGIVRWWLGGGLGAPVASVDDNAWQAADVYAMTAKAWYDSYLWVPDHLPLVVTGGADIRVVEFMSLQFSGEGLNYIRVVDRNNVFNDDDFELFVQSKAGVEFRHAASGIGGGAHFKAVFLATVRGDKVQTSLEPFFGWTGEHFFVRFGLIMALDERLGPPFGDDDPGDPSVFSQHGIIGGSW